MMLNKPLQNLIELITIFISISIASIPLVLYVAFKKLEHNGSGLGFVGFYLVKWLRKLK